MNVKELKQKWRNGYTVIERSKINGEMIAEYRAIRSGDHIELQNKATRKCKRPEDMYDYRILKQGEQYMPPPPIDDDIDEEEDYGLDEFGLINFE